MKVTFFFSCCVAKLIDDMFTNRRRRRKCIFWSIVVGSLATVFIVTAVRDALLASRFICTVDDIVSNHITKLCEVIEKEEEPEHGHILEEEPEHGHILEEEPEHGHILEEEPEHGHTLFRQDLCKELCVPGVSLRITCHTFHLNKPAVFTLDTEEKKVIKSVIKLEDREVPLGETSTEENEVYWNLKPGSHQYFPTKDDFLGMVSVYINNFVGDGVSKDIVDKLFNQSNLYQTEPESLTNHRNFWMLIQDHEFLTSVVFEEMKLFPSVLGTCGTYYAMKYLEPLTKNALQPFKLTWRKRLWKAIDIVRYLGQLETVWKEPLHLCDVKHDHFGWDDQEKVMFLDLDSVLPESSLLKTMENTPQCSDNDDCSYFDCKGRCHYRTAKCELERSNTNLQVVCDKIFLGNTDGLISLYGLLVSHEANGELVEALELCKTNRGMTVDGMLDVIMKASNTLMY